MALLFTSSNKSWTRPSAVSTGTLCVDSASATRAGKDCVQSHPWSCQGPTVTRVCAPGVLHCVLPVSAPSPSPGEGTRATAPRRHPPTTKPASAPGTRSRARDGASACAGSASATPRSRPCASTAPSASSTSCSARAPPASSATVRAPPGLGDGCAGLGGTDRASWWGLSDQ